MTHIVETTDQSDVDLHRRAFTVAGVDCPPDAVSGVPTIGSRCELFGFVKEIDAREVCENVFRVRVWYADVDDILEAMCR